MRTLRWAVAVKASIAGMNSTARIFPTVCCFGVSGWGGVDAAGVCGLEGAAAEGGGVVGSGEGGWAAS